ncbi:hypothetical protein IMZ48_49310 [Candidatus Bathyarchaeota archaeon]|nr:hypothetical protein [Candidatus Bathyarchaeota archaeon]
MFDPWSGSLRFAFHPSPRIPEPNLLFIKPSILLLFIFGKILGYNTDNMPPRKRAASTVLDEPRRSRRTTSTPKKSDYFEGGEESDDPLGGGKPEKPKGRRASAKKPTIKAEEVVSDEYEDDDAAKDEAGDEGEGDEEEDDDEDDMDTKVTIVRIPGLRPDGGMEYADEYVHQNSRLFLKDLKQNNVRSWLKCTCSSLIVEASLT